MFPRRLISKQPHRQNQQQNLAPDILILRCSLEVRIRQKPDFGRTVGQL